MSRDLTAQNAGLDPSAFVPERYKNKKTRDKNLAFSANYCPVIACLSSVLPKEPCDRACRWGGCGRGL